MPSRLTIKTPQQGFTIVELMVGVFIGLISVLIVSQILVVNEGQKRTTTAGADSLINGSLALYAIERDGKNAGFGITSLANLSGCEIHAINPNLNNGNLVTLIMAPVVISDGANGAPDSLRFLSSAKTGINLPTTITVDHPPTAANFFVTSDVGISQGDLMIAVPAGGCTSTNWATVIQVTKDGGSNGNQNNQGQGQNQVLHNSGQSDWNPPGGQNIMPSAGYVEGDYLMNLGQMSDRNYSIVNNALQLSENSTGGLGFIETIQPHIVQLQAQYGKDTDGDSVNCNSVGAWNNTTPAANDAAWQKICAIRIAVVARSSQWEREEVTVDDPTCADPKSVCWYGGQITNLNTGNTNADDWKHYRYKVFQTVIPFRNLIWRQ